ncbi:hypothetical protein B0A90_08490 [Pseudomonas syringae]|nr:hypothetical protein B1F67_25940 [Pseudomonas syringae]RXU07129.1 hypothetical protein B1F70_24275 [Pseudomonas syringae]RXU17911.1 hypothetical protein BXU05_00755 [Pseudomonas syringae]RXU41200.1 hypothetical protein B0A90_08490 [Pseudomonas syringae]
MLHMSEPVLARYALEQRRGQEFEKKMAMRQYLASTLMPVLNPPNGVTIRHEKRFEYSSHVPERPRSN